MSSSAQHEKRSGTMSHRISFWLWAGSALLVINSAYLFAAGGPGVFYLGNLLLHLVLALALLAPFVLWWRRRRRALVSFGSLLLAGSAIAGLLLVVLGNRNDLRVLLASHVGLAVAGFLVLLAAFARTRGGLWRISVAGLVLAIMVPLTFGFRQSGAEGSEAGFSNPPAPASLPDQAMGGAEGPFYPSALSTENGGLLSAAALTQPQSCGRSGCHPDVYAQWSSSTHRFSGLDNPWYRKTFEEMQEDRGEVPARWCGGCHTPAILASGMMDQPLEETADTPAAAVGVSCTVCHGITRIKSTTGQADYELAIAPLHAMATSSNRFVRALHDFLVRVDPEPHRRTYSKPFLDSSEFCAPCHSAFLDKPLNDDRFLRAMSDYEGWQIYSPAGESVALSMHFPEPQTCAECHMPLVPSTDAGHDGGHVRSHRFASTNTALPAWRGDEEQLQATIDFLQDNQVTVDIFAMSKGRPLNEVRKAKRDLEIYAPLDRLPATLRRGETTRFDVLVRSRGVGHLFPGGKAVFRDCWLELKAVDDRGQTVFWNGRMDAEGHVEPGAHFFGALWIDQQGRQVEGYQFWKLATNAYGQNIEPYSGMVVRFRLDVPAHVGDELTLTARLRYRKFRPEFTRRVFADLDVETPTLPVVTMAETTMSLPVVDADAALPDMGHPETVPEVDFERWADYGYGLANSGDMKLGFKAMRTALELKPDFVEGWVMLANLEWFVGDSVAAREALERAFAIDPENMRARYYLGMVELDDRRDEAALEHFAKVLEHYPRERQVWRESGRTFFHNGDYEKAVDALNNALAVESTTAANHLVLAMSHRALGNAELSQRHKLLYDRFRRSASAQEIVATYLKTDPHANAERQALHEHTSLPLDEPEPTHTDGDAR